MDALLLIALVGVAVGAVVMASFVLRATRRGSAGSSAPPRSEHGSIRRLDAQVHTGWEQTLIGLARELHLPLTADDLPYGAVSADRRTEHRTYIRTRSEIGRGFVATLDVIPHQGPTTVDYAVLQLPSDEQLHVTVREFEHALIAALQKIDSHVVIRTVPDPLYPTTPETRPSDD